MFSQLQNGSYTYWWGVLRIFFWKPLIKKQEKQRKIICKGSKQCKMCLRECCMLNGEEHLREVQWLEECAMRNSSVVFLCHAVHPFPAAALNSAQWMTWAPRVAVQGKLHKTCQNGLELSWSSRPSLFMPQLWREMCEIWHVWAGSEQLTGQHSPSVRAWIPFGGVKGLPWDDRSCILTQGSILESVRSCRGAGVFCSRRGARSVQIEAKQGVM